MTGALFGTLRDASSNPIVIDGLWALKTRIGGPSVNTNAVYFTAGINDEANGLFGSLAIPEPGTLSMMGIAMPAASVAMRRRRVR